MRQPLNGTKAVVVREVTFANTDPCVSMSYLFFFKYAADLCSKRINVVLNIAKFKDIANDGRTPNTFLHRC